MSEDTKIEEIKKKAEEAKKSISKEKVVEKEAPKSDKEILQDLEKRVTYLEQQLSIALPQSDPIEANYKGKLYKITKFIPSDYNPDINVIANTERNIGGRKVVFDENGVGIVTEKQLEKALSAGYKIVN